jgi:hypothetical protein
LKADVSKHLFASAILLVAGSACFPGCGDLAPFVDACTKARDLGYVTGVQLAEASSSGNAIIGQGGALHRQGKVVFALRAGGVARTSPRFAGVGIRTDSLATSTRFATDRGTTATISADIAAGAVSGVRVGDTRMGGVDLLLGVTAIPNRDLGSVHVRGKPLDLALGLRLGILEETKSLPGLSLSAQLRTPPRYSVTMPPLIGADGRHVSISVTQVDITHVRLATRGCEDVGEIRAHRWHGQGFLPLLRELYRDRERQRGKPGQCDVYRAQADRVRRCVSGVRQGDDARG